MYSRSIRGRELTFDFAEGLLNDNLLIVDRETSSLWSQLQGTAVDGPMEGAHLPVVPSLQTTWGFWREHHPETRVLVVEGETGRPYFYRTRRPGSSRPGTHATSHDVSALGLGLSGEGDAIYLSFSELARAETPLRLDLAGRPVTVHYEPEALSAWATDEEGRLLPGVLVYGEAWLEFHPRSRVFRAERGE